MAKGSSKVGGGTGKKTAAANTAGGQYERLETPEREKFTAEEIGGNNDEVQKRIWQERGTFDNKKTLYNKGQVDTLTKDYTPQMFLGNLNEWDGTGAGLREMAEQNMPRTLNIGGYEFKNDHNNIYRPSIDYDGKNRQNTITVVTYQSTEKVGNEYPVIQIGIRARKRRGKVQAEIIRDGWLNRTKFW